MVPSTIILQKHDYIYSFIKYDLVIKYVSTRLFRFFKDAVQSARKSSQDVNVDDFLGYIEIPVKVQNREFFVGNNHKSIQNVVTIENSMKNLYSYITYKYLS